MKVKNSLQFRPLKLHTRTTIAVSAVLIAVFAIVAYITDLTLTRLSNQDERQDAQLIASRIAGAIEHHLQRQRRGNAKSKPVGVDEGLAPNWSEIEETIKETIADTHPELSQIRVMYHVSANEWREEIRLPATLGPLSEQDEADIKQHLDMAKVLAVRDAGESRLLTAMAPIFFTFENQTAKQVGTVYILLSLDRSQSDAAALRRLMLPLLALAIVIITLTTYFLFQHIVYEPIEQLLAAMAKAEKGNLTVTVEQATADEIGRLAVSFNHMLGQIRRMTEQLTFEQNLLEKRVGDATGELAERNAQLEEANLRLFEMQRQLTQFERLAAAGQLAAQFAHEVGTPLNLISGHVQVLRARADDERTTKRLDTILVQIERITKIVRSMLDSTRRPKPKFARVDVNALLEQILDATQPTLVSRNVELAARVPGEPLLIQADPDQLQQVFINLINNSLDAMPAGGSLSVHTAGEDGYALIELSDTGEGIPGDEIGMIFDPLFSTKGGRGTGLGLTVVKQIITEHAGTVEVESELSRQTIFRIRLPLRQEVEI